MVDKCSWIIGINHCFHCFTCLGFIHAIPILKEKQKRFEKWPRMTKTELSHSQVQSFLGILPVCMSDQPSERLLEILSGYGIRFKYLPVSRNAWECDQQQASTEVIAHDLVVLLDWIEDTRHQGARKLLNRFLSAVGITCPLGKSDMI